MHYRNQRMTMLSKTLIDQMYAEYQAGATLAGLGKKSHRDRRSVREIFERRGLEVRPHALRGETQRDPATGRLLPGPHIHRARNR